MLRAYALYVPLWFMRRFPLEIRAPRLILFLCWPGMDAPPAEPLFDLCPPVPTFYLISMALPGPSPAAGSYCIEALPVKPAGPICW